MSEPTNQPVWYSEADASRLVQQAVQQALTEQAQTHAAQQASQGTITAAQAQAMIDEALARQAEAHNSAMQALAAAMRGSVASLIPEHSGGPGVELHETWSQFEQELAWAAAEAARRAA